MKRAIAALLVLLFVAAGSADAAAPLIPPSETGPFGLTRLQMFDHLLGVWFRTDRQVVQHVDVTGYFE